MKVIVEVYDKDKDKSCCCCCCCGLTPKQLKKKWSDKLFHLSIGSNKMFVCHDCLVSIYSSIGYVLGTEPI